MSRIKLVIELASMALASVIVAGLALGPETVTRKLDNALRASWRALGDHLASRELDAIARELDRERQNFEHIGALRDEIVAHLQSLSVRRECVRAQMEEQRQPRGDGPARASPRRRGDRSPQGGARCADFALEAARRKLREHETALITVRAAADTSRMNRVLTLPVSDPSVWNERIDRIDEFLRTTSSHDCERNTRPKLTGLP